MADFGTEDSPFDDVDSEEEPPEADAQEESDEGQSQETEEGVEDEHSGSDDRGGPDPLESVEKPDIGQQESPDADDFDVSVDAPELSGNGALKDMPFVLRRKISSKGIDFGRTRGGKFLAQESTIEKIDAFASELSDSRYPEADVSIIDVREALILAGLENQEDAVEYLDAWGYPYIE